MAKQEFLMLAHKFNTKKTAPGGWWISEKLDGQRCLWDGGITRGEPKDQVPWANTKKDKRYKETQICTGLWTRYGNVIHAPDEWLDGLPKDVCIDGELWMGDYSNGSRQTLRSIISKLEGQWFFWQNVKLYAFDIPPYDQVFFDRKINTVNMKVDIVGVQDWFRKHGIDVSYQWPRYFGGRVEEMAKVKGKSLVWHYHERLPHGTPQATQVIEKALDWVLSRGGEGLMLRSHDAVWKPERSHDLLKHKPFDDDEGTVVGFITGRKTEKGSKLLGKMGALILDYKGQRLELSGFTEKERRLGDLEEWAEVNPETEVVGKGTPEFSIGTSVTFKYRGLSKDGIPQEARYWRKR